MPPTAPYPFPGLNPCFEEQGFHLHPLRWILAVCLLMTSCLKFGSDEEWLYPDVTQKHLDDISLLTEIKFPQRTTGLAYAYFGSGIDDAFAAKVKLPAGKVSEILKNDIFTRGEKSTSIQLQGVGSSCSWWKPEELTDVQTRKLQIKGNEFLGCILGKSGGDHFLYITWFDT